MKTNSFFNSIADLNKVLELQPPSIKVVYTYGAWDLLHPGHVIFLQRAKELGDFLVVGVISDGAIRSLKGADRPIQSGNDRLFVVKNLKCVDFAIRQPEYDPSDILRKMHSVKILTKGDDWDYIPGQETIESLGGHLVTLSYSKDYSTSNLVSTIRKN